VSAIGERSPVKMGGNLTVLSDGARAAPRNFSRHFPQAFGADPQFALFA